MPKFATDFVWIGNLQGPLSRLGYKKGRVLIKVKIVASRSRENLTFDHAGCYGTGKEWITISHLQKSTCRQRILSFQRTGKSCGVETLGRQEHCKKLVLLSLYKTTGKETVKMSKKEDLQWGQGTVFMQERGRFQSKTKQSSIVDLTQFTIRYKSHEPMLLQDRGIKVGASY